uniref:Putative glycosyltransferase n=1 Tax=viral metagenome TaxID=1070528 RepID=A0A6M3J2F6_9ZZZZ
MKLLWYSVAPWAPTGYGVVTKEIVHRMQKEGHEVTVATKHFHCGEVEWEGIKTITGMDVGILNRMVDRGEADYIITLLDNHAIAGIPKNWISYTPFDTNKIPSSIKRDLAKPLMLIALTEWGQEQMIELGYPGARYAPHGFNPEVFCPNDAKRQEGKKALGWEDKFIIGAVGVNYGDDRKNFVNLFRAFKRFHDRHPEARLYMSSNTTDTDGTDYLPRAMEDLGLKDLVKWSDPDQYLLGRVSEGMMANRYRMMDVMCLPTKGEGFGIPLIEAQACGVPVITTGASTGPELCPSQYLVYPNDDEWEWFNKEWRPCLSPTSIDNALEKAYNDKQRALVGDHGRKDVQRYQWDTVFDTYWKPILKEIEGLKVKVQRYPDYKKLYESFTGRIAMGDCKKWCKDGCPGVSVSLPGESNIERNIIFRSYPVAPVSDSTLYVHKKCPMYNWISQRFKKEVTEAWEYLWGFPVIRDAFKESAPDGMTTPEWIPLDCLDQEFDEGYKWAMQSHYRTSFPDCQDYLKGSILEVGCGTGVRVRQLRKMGKDAVGIETNHVHVNNDSVLPGNAMCLVYKDNSFNTVFSVDVLEHLSEPLRAISEAFRVSSDIVILSVTPVEDPCFMEDPTHCVEWDRERWKREVAEFGDILDIREPFTIIARKRKVE